MTDHSEQNAGSSGLTPRKICFFILKLTLSVALLSGVFVLWVIGCLSISFGCVNSGSMIIFWTLLLLSLQVVFQCLIYGFSRKIVKWSGFFSILFLAGLLLIPAWRWYKVERFQRMDDKVNWGRYQPWGENTKVVVVTPEEKFKISGALPRIDGAYALYPVYSGVVRALYPRKMFEEDQWMYLTTNGSDVTFRRLIKGEVDLIFSAPPSQKQIADAAGKGLTYEITPFAKEAFVFFVNSRNPVENLTSEQIRQIYSGKITDWSQIDPRYSGAIKPFQRNEGSGSQTMLQKIMGSTPIMQPLREDRLGGMGGIINDVAGYRNYQEALGFTFRYFSTEMFRNGEIKLLSIDGVAPTLENIRNGSYPFLADCCIITVKPRSENVKKIVDFMFSPAGQELVDKTGYTPLSRASR